VLIDETVVIVEVNVANRLEVIVHKPYGIPAGNDGMAHIEGSLDVRTAYLLQEFPHFPRAAVELVGVDQVLQADRDFRGKTGQLPEGFQQELFLMDQLVLNCR
jgi:hypothetical protein